MLAVAVLDVTDGEGSSETEATTSRRSAFWCMLPYITTRKWTVLLAWFCSAISVVVLLLAVNKVSLLAELLGKGDVAAVVREGAVTMCLFAARALAVYVQDTRLFSVATASTCDLKYALLWLCVFNNDSP